MLCYLVFDIVNSRYLGKYNSHNDAEMRITIEVTYSKFIECLRHREEFTIEDITKEVTSA